MTDSNPSRPNSDPASDNSADDNPVGGDPVSGEFSPELLNQVERLERLLSHLWMVRQFLKHCDEAEDDEDLCDVQRELYDYLHAVGIHVEQGRPDEAMRFAKKKLRRLRDATKLFDEIQEEISTHTNFRMARRSLLAVLESIESLLKAEVK